MQAPKLTVDHAKAFAEGWLYQGKVYVVLDAVSLGFATDLANMAINHLVANLQKEQDDKKIIGALR